MIKSVLITGVVSSIENAVPYRFTVTDNSGRTVIAEWNGAAAFSVGDKILIKGESRFRKIRFNSERYISVSEITLIS